jgi:hypothetical protein
MRDREGGKGSYDKCDANRRLFIHMSPLSRLDKLSPEKRVNVLRTQYLKRIGFVQRNPRIGQFYMPVSSGSTLSANDLFIEAINIWVLYLTDLKFSAKSIRYEKVDFV